jgi:ubiquinone/menaquinone biosynthesis C-methylase UbiE
VRDGEFNDPSLVPLYDAAFPWSRADDFFVAAVNETPAARVLDLGCGTGRLALGLSAAGHVVTGIDPASASIAAARRKPGADAVTWVVGTSRAAPAESFDVAVMTSHVAQFMVTDREWSDALADLRRALVAGGRLIFDSRDPAYRAWEAWNPDDSLRTVDLPVGSSVRIWNEGTSVHGDVVDFTLHYRFPEGGELLSSSTLRFRSEEGIRSSLREQGFVIEYIFGGREREAVGAGDGEFIVVTRASELP